jgi:2-deoxy-D-gluconate 3-dehydrogenase
MKEWFDLKNKVALITGGNGGVGKGIAEALASAGSDIVIAARNETKTAQAVKDIKDKFGVRVLGVRMDISEEDSVISGVRKAISEFGHINILVNNAGVNRRKEAEEVTVDDWDYVLNTNLRGAFLCAKAVHPAMKAAGGGKIINIGSMTSLLGIVKALPYACSKMGLLSLTYCLGLEWAKYNIQVNAIVHSWIESPLSGTAEKDFPGITQWVRQRTPAGRWGKPSDVGKVAVFLASQASDFVSASYVRADGGFIQGGITPIPFSD